jgi:hypothetical protein
MFVKDSETEETMGTAKIIWIQLIALSYLINFVLQHLRKNIFVKLSWNTWVVWLSLGRCFHKNSKKNIQLGQINLAWVSRWFKKASMKGIEHSTGEVQLTNSINREKRYGFVWKISVGRTTPGKSANQFGLRRV